MKLQIEEKTISIALCTYEGAFFLEQQLDSLKKQSISFLELVICDDASTDATASIIKAFSKMAPFPVRIYRNEKQIGAVQNFSRAISLCQGKYIALCDQDDIWFPDKLAITFQAMKEAEEKFGSQFPLLVHSDLTVIDTAGKVIVPSFMKLRRIRHFDEENLKWLLAQNFVTGNTVLMNRPLVEVALPIPAGAMMHDWWLALVAAAVGKIVYIDRPMVLYRQHASNMIGAGGFFTLENAGRILDINARERELAASIGQVMALADHLVKINGHKIPDWLNGFLSGVTQEGLKAFQAPGRYGVGKQGLIRNIIYRLLLLKGGFLKYLQ